MVVIEVRGLAKKFTRRKFFAGVPLCATPFLGLSCPLGACGALSRGVCQAVWDEISTSCDEGFPDTGFPFNVRSILGQVRMAVDISQVNKSESPAECLYAITFTLISGTRITTKFFRFFASREEKRLRREYKVKTFVSYLRDINKKLFFFF